MLENEMQEKLREGIAAHQAGKLQEAELKYFTIIRSQPEYAHAYYLVGVVCMARGDGRTAEGFFRDALARDESPVAYRCGLGHACRFLGKLEDAVGEYQEALKKEPENRDALLHLILTQISLGNMAGASTALQTMKAAHPQNPQTRYAEAMLQAAQGNYDEAHQSFEQALSLAPQFYDAHLGWGQMLLDNGALDEAESRLRRLLTLNSQDPRGHSVLGEVFWRQGRLEWAVGAFETAVQKGPWHREAYLGLARTRWQKGAYRKSLDAWRHAFYLNPKDRSIYKELGRAYLAGSEWSWAHTFLVEAGEDAPEDYESAYWQAGALYFMERRDASARVMREALARETESSAAKGRAASMVVGIDKLDEDSARKLVVESISLLRGNCPLWLKRAESGDAEAAYALGLVLLCGAFEVEASLPHARYWFGRAAELGHAEAVQLHACYRDGLPRA